MNRRAVETDHSDLEWNVLSAQLDGAADGMLQPAAAGDDHARERDAADGVLAEDLRKLLGIIGLVKLRAANKCYPALDEVIVKTTLGQAGNLPVQGNCVLVVIG